MPYPPDDRFDDEPPPEEMPRRRRDDDFLEDDDEATHKEDDYVYRIRRRRYTSWVERQLLTTNMVLLCLLPFCCGLFALVFGIVGLAVSKDPVAKQRALIITIISGCWIAFATVLQVVAAIVEEASK